MKKILFLFALGLCSLGAWASYDFGAEASTGQTLYYTISDATAHTVSVSFPGTSTTNTWTNFTMPSGSLTIPSSVEDSSGTAYTVTSIGISAFKNCSGITSLTIPNSVTIIENSAFSGCSGITSLTIPSSVTSIKYSAFKNCTGITSVVYNATNCTQMASSSSPVFDGCTNLASLTIGENVTNIPSYAFCLCTGLSSVTIGNSVSSIGSYAFLNCTSLTSVTIPSSVTNISSYAFNNCTSLANIVYNATNCTTMGNSLNHVFEGCTNPISVTIGENVTNIPNFAFSGCSSLTSMTIPGSVTSIGTEAFLDCVNLSNVYYTGTIEDWCGIAFGNNTANPLFYAHNLHIDGVLQDAITIPSTVTSIGNYAFEGWSGLTSVDIPNSVTSIGNNAFEGCSGLTSVDIPNSVTSIGNNAFEGCSGLTSVTIPSLVTSIESSVFNGCSGLTSMTIPSLVTSIGPGAFYGCSSLTSVDIPSSVTSIGDGAFQDCSGLTSVSIPSSMTSIGSYAFYNCDGLTSVHYTGTIADWCGIAFGGMYANPVYYAHNLYINDALLDTITIPNSVDNIGNYTFQGCNVLKSVTIPSSVTSIGNNAFQGCSGLTSMTIPSSVTSIGNSAFSSCSSLTSLTIPSSVTSIGNSAFSSCSGLTSMTIPNSVTSLGSSAFRNCTSLTSVTIPNSVTSIGEQTFYGCSSLTSLTIPNSVTSIEKQAFNKCSNLTSVVIGKSVTTIGSSAFNSCSKLGTIYNLSGLTLTTGASTYGNVAKNAKRVIVPDTFGTGANMLYQIPDTYRVKTTTTSATEVPTNAIPTNFIYDSLGDGNWKAHQIVLTDDTSRFEVPVDFTAAKATYTREFTNSNRSTPYLPFGVAEASTPENLEVYEFAGFNGSSISFAEHTGDIAAYTPYLVGYEISTKDGSTTKCTFSLEDVFFAETASASPDYVTTDGDESYGYIDFLGTTQRTCMTNTNYGYSNGYFVQSGNGTDHTGHAHVNPFRCYFSYIPGSAPMGIPPALDIDIVDGELAIDEAEMPAQQSRTYYSNDVYDMMGRLIRRNAQSLEGLPTGVYIWKGQKVLAY